MMWRWAYETQHVVLHVLFGVHSPTRVYMGTCWCQRWRGHKRRIGKLISPR